MYSLISMVNTINVHTTPHLILAPFIPGMNRHLVVSIDK